jgi:putative transposase
MAPVAASNIYHVWFATKRRTRLLQGDIEQAATDSIREVARERGVQLLECESAVNHVHLLLRLGEGQSLPGTMNHLKGASSYRLHRAYPELKLDSRSENLWQRGYGFTLVAPGSLAERRRYIRTQMERLDRFEKTPPRCRVL